MTNSAHQIKSSLSGNDNNKKVFGNF